MNTTNPTSISESFPNPPSISEVAHEVKPAKVIPAGEKRTWLGKHVRWLKEERHGWNKVGITAYRVLETLVLTASVIGIVLLIREAQESKRLDIKAQYFQKAEKTQPPPDHPIETKSSTRSFNHIQEFAIENGILWMRHRHSKDQWKPVYFDGFAKGREPKSLSCDGANLVVLDDQNIVHYKKVLKEIRKTEVQKSERPWLERAGVNLEHDDYIAVDKGDRNNWKDKWFSLPFAHYIINLFTGKSLKIPSDAKAWAISQRGRYNDYLEDQQRHKHAANVGVTTLYVLDKNGKDIYKYDPWSPKYVKISIPVPETPQTSFEAENMSVSASVIMAIGYEVQKDHPERRTLQIYTRLADIDSEGWNPGLKYDYFDHPESSDIHVVPLPQWISHPIELDEGDFITKDITIIQTGAGNNARELRVEGQRGGQKGFFFKKVDEDRWHFEPLNESENQISRENALPLEQENTREFQTTVQNYHSEKVNIPTLSQQTVGARLSNFGQRAYHSKLTLTIDGKEYELDLHKKKTLKNFIGFAGDSYDLVIPENLHQNPDIIKAFKGQKVIPLTADQNNAQLRLKGGNFEIELRQDE